MNQEVNSKHIKILLIIVVVVLAVGLFVYPEYRDYRSKKQVEEYAAQQEASKRRMLETEIVLLQSDSGDWSIPDEEIKAMSIDELEYAKKELGWKIDFEKLIRQCGNNCPEELTWTNYLLAKTFEE
jgi:hypothetical protein